MSKTTNLKTKIEARSTPKLENEAPYVENEAIQRQQNVKPDMLYSHGKQEMALLLLLIFSQGGGNTFSTPRS